MNYCNTSDLIVLALYYKKIYNNENQVSFIELKKYYEIINENLNLIGSKISISNIKKNKDCINAYDVIRYQDVFKFIINDNIDINDFWHLFIGCLSYDLVISSKMSNSLEALGIDLEKINESSLRRKNE